LEAERSRLLAETLRPTVKSVMKSIEEKTSSIEAQLVSDEVEAARRGLGRAGEAINSSDEVVYLREGNAVLDRHKPLTRSSSVETLDSVADSLFSVESFSSSSTTPDALDAFQRLFRTLITDPLLADLYEEVTLRTSVTKFSRNFGALLKRFGAEIQEEASSAAEQRAAVFIQSQARKLAKRATQQIFA
jgi:hypothetical protein